MNDLATEKKECEVIELIELSILVKKIWPCSEKWRFNNGNIEFSIKKSDGFDEWFPFYQAPIKVETFIRSWMLCGGD